MITQERLNQIFTYIDGMILWKEKIGYKVIIGKRAGSYNFHHGYREVRINSVLYREHILIWIMHFGTVPDGMFIDHRDRIKINNRIENLRLATCSQNNVNSKVRKDNTSGCKGVSYLKSRNKYLAQSSGKFIGHFNTLEQASAAYNSFVEKQYGEFAKLNAI